MYITVKNETALERDTSSGAIVNADYVKYRNAIESYKKMREEKENVQNEINNIKKEVSELKTLILETLAELRNG